RRGVAGWPVAAVGTRRRRCPAMAYDPYGGQDAEAGDAGGGDAGAAPGGWQPPIPDGAIGSCQYDSPIACGTPPQADDQTCCLDGFLYPGGFAKHLEDGRTFTCAGGVWYSD